VKRNIKQTWYLEHPVERVWHYISSPELMAQWLMENDFKPVVGHKFQFKTRARPGFDGNIYCEVLNVVPNELLSYSWKGGPVKGKITLDSVVIFTLSPQGTGTRLVLEQNGFDGLKNLMAYFSMNIGWNTKIRKRLEEMLNTQAHATT
jgi:uncharacterized protein YndB with AHSA1/START domain